MLEIGKKYRQVGGEIPISGSTKTHTKRPGFPFGCKVGIYTGRSGGGFDCFDLVNRKGNKVYGMLNGGNYEEVTEKPSGQADITYWIFDNLYKSEINILISTFFDGGYTVKLGDEQNGFKEETNQADCLCTAALNLAQWACRHYPKSAFAEKYIKLYGDPNSTREGGGGKWGNA